MRKRKLILISSDAEFEQKLKSTQKQINLELKQQNLWTLSRSINLKQLSRESVDIFVDLNETPTLLGIYLSCKMKATVRTCLAPPHRLASFNLIYHHNEAASYPEKLNGFITFLNQFD